MLTASPAASARPSASGVAIVPVPPPDSLDVGNGCGATPVYMGGIVPDWANVNRPKFLPYVVASPGIAVGYLFSGPPQPAGLNANTKVLWYVGPPRNGTPLEAEGHPLGSSSPTVQFSKSADSSPGEIYPSGPTVPFGGCWHFTLTWQGGSQQATVDLLFK